jgi:hypothetical protein
MTKILDESSKRSGLACAIVERLRTSRRQVRFVTDVENAVLIQSSAKRGDFEQELSQLENLGTLLVRPQYCADPHLAGTDLRLAALVDREDAEAALISIEAEWQEWLKGYLASHRCT